MAVEVLPADRRLRRTTAIVLVLAGVAAIVLMFAFAVWMRHLAATVPGERLIAEMRRAIALSVLATGLCLLLLAGYGARLARLATKERRWPLGNARVLRDTPIRRDEDALRIARWLNGGALALIALAIVTMAISWRLFVAAS